MFGRLRAKTPSGGSGQAVAPSNVTLRRRRKGLTSIWAVGPSALPCAGGFPPQRPLQKHASPTMRRNPNSAAQPRWRLPTKIIPVGAPLVGALPPWVPPRGLDSADETSTLFLLPYLGSSVSLQKKSVELLPLMIGISIGKHSTIVCKSVRPQQTSTSPKNQKPKTTIQPSPVSPMQEPHPVSDRRTRRSGWQRRPPPQGFSLRPVPRPNRR